MPLSLDKFRPNTHPCHMTSTTARGTLAERLAPIREQDRYRSDVEEHGLDALFAPYAGVTAVPAQRQTTAA